MNLFRRMGLIIVVVLAVTLTAGAVHASTIQPGQASSPHQDGQTPEDICAKATENIQEPATRTFDKAENVLKDGVDYAAVICTAQGPIFIDLLEKDAPVTVNNFVFLAQNGFYNNTTFHRVLPGFMAQGGDPTGTGTGDAGYSFDNENTGTFDTAGIVAMANSGPNTNGSQFFITYVPTDWLNGSYNIFGKVISGMESAELLRPRDPQNNPTFDGDLLQTVVIIEDPSTVKATPDGAPSLDFLQKMLSITVADQIIQQLPFEVVADASQTYDLQAEAESWQATGGDALVAYMTDYLTSKGFLGTASVNLKGTGCDANLPLWALGFQISDYGTADAAQAIVSDKERSDKLVETGAFESYTDPEGVTGRVYVRDLSKEEGWCSTTAKLYRLESPQGRYLATVDMVVDSSTLDEQNTVGVLNDLMGSIYLPSVMGALDRGNAEVAAAQ